MIVLASMVWYGMVIASGTFKVVAHGNPRGISHQMSLIRYFFFSPQMKFSRRLTCMLSPGVSCLSHKPKVHLEDPEAET